MAIHTDFDACLGHDRLQRDGEQQFPVVHDPDTDLLER